MIAAAGRRAIDRARDRAPILRASGPSGLDTRETCRAWFVFRPQGASAGAAIMAQRGWEVTPDMSLATWRVGGLVADRASPTSIPYGAARHRVSPSGFPVGSSTSPAESRREADRSSYGARRSFSPDR